VTKNHVARSLAVASLTLGMTAGMTLGAHDASATSILIDKGATTYDPSTHLSWLDLTATAGQSYNAVTGGFGGYLSDGWRYASSGELGQLFTDAGGVGPFDGFPPNYPAASNLLSLLGILRTSFPFATSIGLLSDPGAAPGTHTIGYIALEVFIRGSLNTYGGYLQNSTGRSDVGSFLVKADPLAPPVATTPIPATLPLFGAALGGLGFIGWRKKQAVT